MRLEKKVKKEERENKKEGKRGEKRKKGRKRKNVYHLRKRLKNEKTVKKNQE